MITINIGPYRIDSEDAFLDSNDRVINNETGIKTSFEEVASYIDMISQQCNSEFANKWRDSVSGGNHLLLKDAEQFLKDMHCISTCSKDARPLLAVSGVNIKECYLQVGKASLPILVSTNESYPKLLNTKPDPLLTILGGKLSKNGNDWNFHTGNCHAYALHEYLGISPNTAFNDLQGSLFSIENIPNNTENVYLVSNPGTNGFQTALENFYRPVGLIGSEDVPMFPMLCQNLMAYSRPEDTQDIRKFISAVDQVFQDKLNEMLRTGAITKEKLEQRKYVLTMGHVLSSEIEETAKNIFYAEHTGILIYKDGKFYLEAKLSFSDPVYETSISAQAFLMCANTAAGLFMGSMTYIIYEPELNDTTQSFNLESALAKERAGQHPMLYRKLEMPREKAAAVLKIANDPELMQSLLSQ